MHASGQALDAIVRHPVIFASIFQGETLDMVADYIAIFVLFFVPAVLVYLWDGRDRMAVVRVFGRSAKVRTLYYFRGEKSWRK